MITNVIISILVVMGCIALVAAAPFIFLALLVIVIIGGAIGIGCLTYAILQDINQGD